MSDIGWAYIMILPVLGGALAAAALLIWWERRLLGFWQDRLGPNRVGPFGILQLVARYVSARMLRNKLLVDRAQLFAFDFRERGA